MQPHHKTNALHVVLTILGALAGIAGSQQWAPAPVPCPVCAVCPEPVVPPTADEIRAKYGIAIPVPADPSATVTP